MPRKIIRKLHNTFITHKPLSVAVIATVTGLFAAAGYFLTQHGSAATHVITAEAEDGAPAGGAVPLSQVPDASKGGAIRFGGTASTETPVYKAEVLLSGRNRPWDIAFLPNGGFLFTERAGTLSLFKDGAASQVAAISDVKAGGEGGLMGVALDPQFAQNRSIYTCMNSTAGDVRIVRWRLADDAAGLQDRRDIVTGITANPSGRHSGCRLKFGPDGNLWIGTGDSATGTQPQQPKSLNGKILRVDRDGAAVPGNPGGGFDSRIYSYGHRNTQGIAFFPSAKNGVSGISSEHGSTVDDEVNELRTGNFGWAPPDGYNESGVPMTDLRRFPDAVQAIWSSGNTTQAVSGIAIINNSRWKGWDGAVAMALQKDQHLKILRLDARNKVTKEEKILQGTYGRLRSVTQGPDGNLYVTSDVGSNNDKIIRLTPQ